MLLFYILCIIGRRRFREIRIPSSNRGTNLILIEWLYRQDELREFRVTDRESERAVIVVRSRVPIDSQEKKMIFDRRWQKSDLIKVAFGYTPALKTATNTFKTRSFDKHTIEGFGKSTVHFKS